MVEVYRIAGDTGNRASYPAQMDADAFADLIERYDHVSVAVRDVESVRPLVDLTGGTFLDGGDNVRMVFRWVQYRLPGNGKIEFIQPLAGNDWLNRHLDKKGEGLHHVTFKVTDLDAAVFRAESLGFTTTGYHRTPDWSEVFVHPRTANGVLIQLAQWDDAKTWATSYADVLAGKVVDLG